MPPMLMKHDVDPREEILREMGDLTGFHIQNNQVLVRVYERPKQTRAGIHLPDQVRQEDQYQGKAALVLLAGPTAFLEDVEKGYWLNEQPVPKIHDWILMRASDGWPVMVQGKLCRMLTDTAVRMVIPAPDMVW